MRKYRTPQPGFRLRFCHALSKNYSIFMKAVIFSPDLPVSAGYFPDS